MPRRHVVAAIVACAGLSLVALAPAATSAPKSLAFSKPVGLSSFAPARTVVGDEYSVQDTQSPATHEWAGEPSIQVDRSGTIYIAGVCCVVAASPVWASHDGGKTFAEMETPGHIREWGVGAEGELATDDKGTVVFTDTFIPSMLTTVWSDHGKTWQRTSPSSGVVPGMNDRPWLAWTPQALYLYVNYSAYVQTYSSTDMGLTWNAGQPVPWRGNINAQQFFPGHIAADKRTGRLWIAGVVCDEATEEDNVNGCPLQQRLIGSGVSTDGGQTWSNAPVSKPQRGFISPIFTGASAVDARGTAYTTWSTYNKTGCDVYYAASTNGGKSWHKPVKVNTGKGCATFPWVAAGAGGKISVVWYQTSFHDELKNVGAGAAYQDAIPKKELWHAYAAAIVGADSKSPAIVRGEIPSGPVLTGPMNRELWDFFENAIGPDGRVYVAFVKKYKDGKPDNAPQTWFTHTTTGPRLR
ncbi:MAG: hypothetical protein LC640_11165 [Frankia sp.]|nr:hypothetical protein [Frankia sp.]